MKEAWELLKFLSDEQSGVTVWKIHGKFPANVRAMQRPELKSDPLVAAFEPMIQVARTPFKSTKYVEITQALGVVTAGSLDRHEADHRRGEGGLRSDRRNPARLG